MPALFPRRVPIGSSSDAELVSALASDRLTALGEIYDRYAPLVFGLARAMLSSTPEAEDLTQEVFVSLCHQCRYDPERGTLGAFLTTVTRSRALDRLRARGRRLAFLRRLPWSGEPTADDDPLAAVSLSQMGRNVQEALGRLPDNQRQVLELAYFKGLTQTEIAQELDLPLGTVKTCARRGLQSLRGELSPLAMG